MSSKASPQSKPDGADDASAKAEEAFRAIIEKLDPKDWPEWMRDLVQSAAEKL